jgi:uncharacterized membrane protein YdcZ (DUF606 family)
MMNDVDVWEILLNWLVFLALLALVYWMWRKFSKLAEKHNKVKWHFGLVGALTFFSAIYVGSLVEKKLGDVILAGTLRVPFALLSCWLLYTTLNLRSKK